MRTGSNQRIWGEMRRKRKNGISRARAIPGKKVTGRERGKGEGWAGQVPLVVKPIKWSNLLYTSHVVKLISSEVQNRQEAQVR